MSGLHDALLSIPTEQRAYNVSAIGDMTGVALAWLADLFARANPGVGDALAVGTNVYGPSGVSAVDCKVGSVSAWDQRMAVGASIYHPLFGRSYWRRVSGEPWKRFRNARTTYYGFTGEEVVS